MWTFLPRASLFRNIIMFISIESTSPCILLLWYGSAGQRKHRSTIVAFRVSSLGLRVDPEINDLKLFAFFTFKSDFKSIHKMVLNAFCLLINRYTRSCDNNCN